MRFREAGEAPRLGYLEATCWADTRAGSPVRDLVRRPHLTVDVVKGRGSGFSVEAPEGVRFLIRSRLLTDEELDHFFGSRQG